MKNNYDVFISYSSNDKKIAFNLCEALEEKKITCWIAPRNVQMGSYANSIIEGIVKSRLFILIFSSSSNNSRAVLNEVELAVKNNLIIIPLRIEEFSATKPLEYYLISNHWFEIFHPKTISDFEEFRSIIYDTINSEKIPLEQSSTTISSKKIDKIWLKVFVFIISSSFLFLLLNLIFSTKKNIKKKEPKNDIINGLTIAVKMQTEELKKTKDELNKKTEEIEYWKKQYLKEIEKHREDTLLVDEAQKIKDTLGFKEAFTYLERQHKEQYLYHFSRIFDDKKNDLKLGYDFMDYLGSHLDSGYTVKNTHIKEKVYAPIWEGGYQLSDLKWNHSLRIYDNFFPIKDILYPDEYHDTYISNLLNYNYDINKSFQLSGM